MGPRSHPPRSLTLPGAPWRVHWLFSALASARREVPTRSLALSRARQRSLALPGVLCRSRGGARDLSPPGPPTRPGSLRGDYRGATPPTTTRREIEAKAKANAKGEKSGSERERRKKRKRKRRRKDLSHTPNRSADLKRLRPVPPPCDFYKKRIF
jgi:hypothetical protein